MRNHGTFTRQFLLRYPNFLLFLLRVGTVHVQISSKLRADAFDGSRIESDALDIEHGDTDVGRCVRPKWLGYGYKC